MHEIDPRIKLLWALLAVLAIFTAQSLGSQIFLCAPCAVIIALGGVPRRDTLRGVRYLIWLLPFTLIMHLLFGTDLLAALRGQRELPPLAQWLGQPLMFSLRLGNFLILMSIVLRWIGAVEFLDAVYYLLRPLRRLRLPVDDLFQIIFIAVRFFPLVEAGHARLTESWHHLLNNGEPVTWRQRLRQQREILIPLMILSFRKAEVLAESMQVRGYRSGQARTYYGQLRWRRRDRLAGLGAVLALLWLGVF